MEVCVCVCLLGWLLLGGWLPVGPASQCNWKMWPGKCLPSGAWKLPPQRRWRAHRRLTWPLTGRAPYWVGAHVKSHFIPSPHAEKMHYLIVLKNPRLTKRNAKKFIRNPRPISCERTDLVKGASCAQLKVWVCVIQSAYILSKNIKISRLSQTIALKHMWPHILWIKRVRENVSLQEKQ